MSLDATTCHGRPIKFRQLLRVCQREVVLRRWPAFYDGPDPAD